MYNTDMLRTGGQPQGDGGLEAPPASALAFPAEEAAAIREQMQRLIESRHFNQSRRYPALLKFMVEAILRGDQDVLHERLIGHLLFQRAADYDTAADPIVRATASEVRKRIAQYYHESAEGGELEIRLSAGSYVPEFVWHDKRVLMDTPSAPEERPTEAPSHNESPVASPAEVANPISDVTIAPPRWKYFRIAVAFGATLAVVATLFAVSYFRGREQTQEAASVVRAVWEPLFAGHTPILICIGELGPGIAATTHQKAPEGDSLLEQFWIREAVSLSDAKAAALLVSFLDKNGQNYRLQSSSETTFTHLREMPSILVSGLDNPWTLKFLEKRRFQFGPSGSGSITDERNAQATGWSVRITDSLKKQDVDYAIAARIFDPDSGRPVIITAGIGGSGTRAASEFLTSEKDLQQLAAMGPRDWQHKSFEVVLRSEVVNTIPGSPTIVGTEFW